jgi:hypothetical protein
MAGSFTRNNQPTSEQRAKSYAIRQIKNKLINDLCDTPIVDVFTEEELRQLHYQYKAKYPTLEQFKKAPYQTLIALSMIRFTLKYDNQTNCENFLHLIKRLDSASLDDLKEAFQPTLQFDTQESLI